MSDLSDLEELETDFRTHTPQTQKQIKRNNNRMRAKRLAPGRRLFHAQSLRKRPVTLPKIEVAR